MLGHERRAALRIDPVVGDPEAGVIEHALLDLLLDHRRGDADPALRRRIGEDLAADQHLERRVDLLATAVLVRGVGDVEGALARLRATDGDLAATHPRAPRTALPLAGVGREVDDEDDDQESEDQIDRDGGA